jgi:hypothetical protein
MIRNAMSGAWCIAGGCVFLYIGTFDNRIFLAIGAGFIALGVWLLVRSSRTTQRAT